MGMYTEINLAVRLRKDTPQGVIDTLTQMTTPDGKPQPHDHPFFKTGRWTWCLTSGGSYYFDATPMRSFRYDDIGGFWALTVITNIKNYTGEWQHLLDWLSPYLDEPQDGDYFGTYRYEESDLPDLIIYDGGKLRIRCIKELEPTDEPVEDVAPVDTEG